VRRIGRHVIQCSHRDWFDHELDGVFVEHVAATEIVTLDVVMFGAAIASGIVARGFHAVPKFETEVLPPSPAEDRIARERAAWARKFKVSA